MKLSILIPVYNERAVVERCLEQVYAAPLPENLERELVIVDDCSRDGTFDILERFAATHPDFVREPPPLSDWHPIDVDAWSLSELHCPVYPQPRFRLVVAAAPILVRFPSSAMKSPGMRSAVPLLEAGHQHLREVVNARA